MSDVSARLREAVARLGRLDLAGVQRDALAECAERLKDDVRQALSQAPGAEHDAPWLETGALRDSIGAGVEDAEAVVGSSDPVAADQEFGTRAAPPRPFLAPQAVRAAPEFAAKIGGSANAALRNAGIGALT